MPSCESGSPNCHFTCPFGGSWHVCRDPPYFVGCCSSDPCTNTTASACPLENLYAAVFEPVLFDKLGPSNCVDHSAENWFTCNYTFQPFIGCCETNPCVENTGCPFGNVLPAAWSPTRTSMYDMFMDASENITKPKTETETSVSGLSAGAIAGITIGGFAGLAILLLGVFLALRSRRRRQAGHTAGEEEKPFLGHYAEYVLRPVAMKQ
ncbi:hypothetical protein ASPSYDRAFT_87592 [Aspergillus sydowii CBS 593.65]|uniref:Uncharacterized protein n=1 Tax=Aspergillus sydowii CBS 593.65 TaxID=1036612 RepID=A0A1L9TNP9_9EURO|nr:uncharacterized protein ASPSYDRAFT_87592 [Aspergillus sydowii CBS 593.65]OJJ61032.1 hypothetical protein ASPSYDRAFT_87592 [Aspergillus sydowii CBS 593.65]